MHDVAILPADTKRQQARFYQQMDAEIDALTKRFERPADAILAAEGRKAASAYTARGAAAALDAPDPQVWFDYIRRLWLTSAPQTALLTAEWIGTGKDEKDVKASSPPDPRARVRIAATSAARLKVDEVGPRKAQELTHTSREWIQEAIDLSTGGLTGTAADILSIFAERRASRSRKIAYTESHESGNFGAVEAARLVQRAFNKVWVATPDNRVRDAHIASQGQSRGIDEMFVVGGQWMMFPGDSSLGASASNICNCRCHVAFVSRRATRPRAGRRA